MNRIDKKPFAALIIAFLIFLMAGCQQSKKKDKQKITSGMEMTRHDSNTRDIDLSSSLKPTNGFVISSIPTTTISAREVAPIINALGTIVYDTHQIGVISARAAGRIDRMYVSYRYQKVSKGQKIMDIYSPELLTDEENLLFLLKNDPDNSTLINDSKERLELLGMGAGQVQMLVRGGKTINAMTIFSSYNGHIHEAGLDNNMNGSPGTMKDISLTTEPLSIKEGSYVQKGQEIFSVYNPGKAWVLLNIYAEDQNAVKAGNKVEINSETSRDKVFKGKIDFIEPFYRPGSKTLTARVYFDNSLLELAAGSQANATIYADKRRVYVLPASAVVSLGTDKIVFRKVNGGFKTQKVAVGNTYNNQIQILNGLSLQDSAAVNAQYLMDSESFIKVNDKR
jgi:Cu(I)/Ag(I) efflux system membrane fusion protein